MLTGIKEEISEIKKTYLKKHLQVSVVPVGQAIV